LYELLVREPPFNADSPLALLAAVVSDPLPNIRDKRPDVSPELAAVIEKCLEKKPEHRYQTVAELADALAPFAPRSQPSVSRISGILRSASTRPLPADKSISSQRTLQSAGPATPTPVSGDQPTEAVKVHVITPAPAAHSEKSTRTDWEASPADGARSLRRAVIVASLAIGGVVALGALWRQAANDDAEGVTPEPSSAVTNGANATPVAADPKPAVASAAPPAPSVPAAPSAAVSSRSVAPAAVSAKPAVARPARVVAAPAPAPVAPAPASAAAPPKPAVVASDPLDGRR
jgi:serine/threonine-protein kinase